MNIFSQVDLSTMDASGPDGVCSGVYSSKRKTYSYNATTNAVATITASVSSSGIAAICLFLDGNICAADTSAANNSSSATCIRSISPGPHILDIILLDTGIFGASASVMVAPL